MKKFSALIAAILIFTMLACPAAEAVSFTPPFEVQSEAAYLINLDTGIVVYEKNSRKKMYPASLTKIMTAILVLENINDLENTNITAPLAVFDELYLTGASSVGYENKEIITAEDLMYAMLMSSACEAAGILGYYVGGDSLTNFVNMMNEKALALGCTDTHFVNTHGLFDEEQYTTARDIAVITQYAMSLPKFTQIASTVEYTPRATNRHEEGWITFTHTNRMLSKSSDNYFPYVKGIKTGTLDESGRCLVTLGSKDGYNYLLVTLGAPTEDAASHYNDHKNIYNWAFDTFSYTKVLNITEMGKVNVTFGEDRDYVLVCPSEEYSTLWPSTVDLSAIDTEIKLDSQTIQAPVTRGTKLGRLKMSISGEPLCEVDLIAMSDINLSLMDYNVALAKQFTKSIWFKLAFVFAGAASILYIVLFIVFTRKRRRKVKRVKTSRRF